MDMGECYTNEGGSIGPAVNSGLESPSIECNVSMFFANTCLGLFHENFLAVYNVDTRCKAVCLYRGTV